MAKKAEIKQDTFPENIGMTLEDIATAVSKVSRGMDAINSSRFRKRGFLILVSSASGVSQRDCERVMQGLVDLEKLFIK